MKLTHPLFLSPLLAVAAVGAVFALQQPSKEEMAKWAAFSTPDEHHKVLDYKVGKWTGHVTMWMAPGAPPMESDSTSDVQWIMGGRYLRAEERGTFMGAPFEGLGITGYDNLKQKYFFTWIDNTGTGVMLGEGSWDAAKKVLSMNSTMSDPMAGKVVSAHGTETAIDANNYRMEMFATGKDGKDFLTMRIDYKRAK